jgi:hypothetical protein
MSLKLENRELISVSRTANAILAAYTLVKPDTDPANVVVCTANARALGVCEVVAAVADPVRIRLLGIVPIKAGTTLATPGTLLVSDSTGRVVAAGATGDQNIVGVQLSTAANANELVSVLLWPTAKYAGTAGGGVSCTLTVGAEVAHPTHTINVTGVLKDYLGTAVAVANGLHCYLSDDAAGQTLVTAVLTADAVIGTDGTILKSLTAKQAWFIVSEANGQFDLTFAKTDGAATVYLNIVMPDGKIVTSGAITFSA